MEILAGRCPSDISRPALLRQAQPRRSTRQIRTTTPPASGGEGRADDGYLDVASDEEVQSLIDDLAAHLVNATETGSDADQAAVRRLIEDLTGGRILITQQGERRRNGGWLRASFELNVIRHIAGHLDCPTTPTSRTVQVDLKDDAERLALADQAFNLYEQGLLVKQIAHELGCGWAKVDRLLKEAFRRRGEEMPDGRSRRAQLATRSIEPPKYASIADEAKRLYDDGALMQEIAWELDCCRDLVTKAIAHWHCSRGLPVPDGRERRSRLTRTVSGPRHRPTAA